MSRDTRTYVQTQRMRWCVCVCVLKRMPKWTVFCVVAKEKFEKRRPKRSVVLVLWPILRFHGPHQVTVAVEKFPSTNCRWNRDFCNVLCHPFGIATYNRRNNIQRSEPSSKKFVFFTIHQHVWFPLSSSNGQNQRDFIVFQIPPFDWLICMHFDSPRFSWTHFYLTAYARHCSHFCM